MFLLVIIFYAKEPGLESFSNLPKVEQVGSDLSESEPLSASIAVTFLLLYPTRHKRYRLFPSTPSVGLADHICGPF